MRFIESNSGMLKEGIVGMVMSFALESTDRPLNITAVEPVADAGLKVTYLGYSYCNRGCAGVANWDDEGKTLARNSIDGTVPLKVPTDGEHARPSLVLVLEPEGAGLETIRHRCLVVRGVRLSLDDGRRLLVDFVGDPIAGIEVEQQGEGYEGCGKWVHGQ